LRDVRADARGCLPQAHRPLGAPVNRFRLSDLFALTWLETKIFVREPLGLLGGVFVPVVFSVLIGRVFGTQRTGAAEGQRGLVGPDLAVFAALLISISSV